MKTLHYKHSSPLDHTNPFPPGYPEKLNLIYQNENLCLEAFRKFKLQSRIYCKSCARKDFHIPLPANQFKCKNCDHISGLRSGTILENLKLPVSFLFIAVHVLLKQSNSATTHQLQQITECDNPELLSILLGKIRAELSTESQAILLTNFLESANQDIKYLI